MSDIIAQRSDRANLEADRLKSLYFAGTRSRRLFATLIDFGLVLLALRSSKSLMLS